jgi:DNA polymerase-3 subunit alpha
MMEKETTGMYISGHPMDDYRKFLKNSHVVPIGELMKDEGRYKDEQIVSVAGIVQTLKMKNTRSGSMMAYVSLEDDTASMEMLAFSNVLSQYGGYIRENEAVVVTGRLSMRDEKEPQIVINRVRPISDFAKDPSPVEEPTRPATADKVREGVLYLRLPSEEDPVFRKIRAILNMFPGDSSVTVYFADTKLRRGTKCALRETMLAELAKVLGAENVVVK